MRLSRFNTKGIKVFQSQLQNMREDAVIKSPLEIIGDKTLVEPVDNGQEIIFQLFNTRHDMAAYLNPVLAKTSIKDDMSDSGLWAWLSAVYIDSVCPLDSVGRRNPKNDFRYIPTNDWRNFYRHLIRGPIRIYRLFENNPETAAIVLCQRPSILSDYAEQLAARQQRITNPAIIAGANRLYYDRNTKNPKRGAAPNWKKPGTLRRYLDLLDQLDLTYDLYSMNDVDILDLLPAEFTPYIS